MYFHGSPRYLTPGTILEPGEKVGYEHNGVTHGCQHVYMTADDGWSISDLHPDDRLGTAEPGRRIVGRALASLRFRQLEDITEDFEDEMEQLQRVTGAVTRALGTTYFDPAS